ncbi:MAG: nucleotidyltransferase domain-containing protein [Candidatus Magasanikbacteria bacterium]
MELNQKQEEKIKELAEKYNINFFILFGSQVDGRTHSESDVDIGFEAEEKLEFRERARLNSELTGVFGNDRVDLVNLHTASPLLFYKIMKDGEVIYTNDPMLNHELYVYAFKKYVETKPLRKRKREKLKNK